MAGESPAPPPASGRETQGDPPRYLLPVALLLWGVATDLLLAAVPLALVVSVAHRLSWRWDLEPRDFDRVTDFTNVLFLGAAGYLFYRDGAHGIFAIARLMPLVLFPLLAAERLSSAGRVPLGALVFSLRRQRADPTSEAHHRVGLGYPYLGVVLVATAVTPDPAPWLYPALAAVTALALFQARPRYAPRWLWATLLLLATATGAGFHQGLRGLQGMMEEWVLAWFEARLWDRHDAYSTTTAIGRLGRLKLSERIVLRVENAPGPLLLRQASYQRYRAGQWSTVGDDFTRVTVGVADGSWVLAPPPAAQGGARIGVSSFTRHGRTLLALPRGSYLLEHMAAGEAHANPYGAVRVADAPGFLFFQASYGPGVNRNAPPAAVDLEVPDSLRPPMARIAQELGLPGVPGPVAVERLRDHFDRHFGYSLASRAGISTRPPLLSFLQEHRAGHCEYFASATVLLLRSAGIPARYAVGYSVQERDPATRGYRVRRRHAHSWAEMYHAGGWLDVDLTPSHWAEEEAEAGWRWWLPLYDAATQAWFTLNRWRWAPEEASAEDDADPRWLLPPLVAWLVWRLARRRRVKKSAPPVRGAVTRERPTPVQPVLDHLARRWEPPAQGETLGAWMDRHLAVDPPLRTHLEDELRELLRIHYRLRFDPRPPPLGVDPAGRIAALLSRLGTIGSPP